jgi:16S rRNA U516 pseudouridylate synthase RsuA-like enzyme
MMLRLGYKVKKLRRIQMGPIKLKGLRPGQWRDLTAGEVKALKRAAFGKEGTKGPRD